MDWLTVVIVIAVCATIDGAENNEDIVLCKRIERTDYSGTTDPWFDLGFCISRPLRPPITLVPRETCEDQFELSSTESPHANPPITMDERTSEFRLTYGVQKTDTVGGSGAVSTPPEEERHSNAFTVKPPAGRLIIAPPQGNGVTSPTRTLSSR